MNTPPPIPPNSPSPRIPHVPRHRTIAADEQIRVWLKLRREMAELHARLEYLRLMLSLGVSQ